MGDRGAPADISPGAIARRRQRQQFVVVAIAMSFVVLFNDSFAIFVTNWPFNAHRDENRRRNEIIRAARRDDAKNETENEHNQHNHQVWIVGDFVEFISNGFDNAPYGKCEYCLKN